MAKLHILTLILRMWKLLFVHGYIRQPRYSFKDTGTVSKLQVQFQNYWYSFKVTGTVSKLQVQFQSYRYISKLRNSFKVTDIVSKLQVLLQMYR